MNQHIICFGPSDWWASNPSCCKHIMNHLSATNRIVYVNPISSDLLGVHSRRGLGTRIVRKLRSLLKFCRCVNDNIVVLSPWFIPIQGKRLFDWTNNVLFIFQLRLVMFFLRVKEPLLWIENIRAADFIKDFKWQLIIYHVSDRFEECPYTKNKNRLKERESCVTENSDLIICVSRELFEAKKKARALVKYLPHGVDYERFRDAVTRTESLTDCRRPVAGYFGTLTAQNDIELLEYCAKQLPNVTFVFAGQITAGDYRGLFRMPNVVFLGKVPYEEIPALCAGFDVCLLPWKVNKWIDNCNPLKFLEYMASGKCIVSVPIKEIAIHSGLISIGRTHHEFCTMIDWELNNDSEERSRRRSEIASKHRWEEHVERISEWIKCALAVKERGQVGNNGL